jgi:CubicO group peptidase (beta-lactamase class C family)
VPIGKVSTVQSARTPGDVAAQIVADGVAPHAAAAWAARRSDGQWELSAGGATDAFFDLASLTKSMTAMAVARAATRATSLRTQKMGALLDAARGTPTEEASLELVLAHRAGLLANLPLFRPLQEGRTVDLAEALIEAASARRPDARGPIPAEGFAPVYSDLGYILAGEAMTQELDVADMGGVLAKLVVEPLGLGETLGSARALESLGDRARFEARVVPTEVVAWRGGEIRGRVHDENAFALRGSGACGHAGMFGTASAVLAFGIAALEAIERGKGPLATDDDLDWLVRPRQGGTLRAGFDGKSGGGGSTAGAIAGPRTFGHLGFTGTSLWIDPDAEAVAVLLTNRVHPTRDNASIRAARPWANDALFRMAAEAAHR